MGDTVHTIQNSRDPVEDGCPEVNPSNEVEVVWRIRFAKQDVVYGLIEDGDRTYERLDDEWNMLEGPSHTSYSSNRQRLGTEYRENERCHERGQQNFRHAVKIGRLYEI